MEELSIPSRQERILELQKSIRRKDNEAFLKYSIMELKKVGIPDEEFDGIATYKELHQKFNGHTNEDYVDAFIEFTLQDRNPSMSTRVLQNIKNTKNSRARLLGEVDSDIAYQCIMELYEAIWDNPGVYSQEDQDTEEIGKGWASGFVEGIQADFQRRQTLSDLDGFNEKYVDSKLSMQKQYVLLRMISARNSTVRKEIFRRVCTILPSNTGFDWRWTDVRVIYDEVVNEKRGLKIKE